MSKSKSNFKENIKLFNDGCALYDSDPIKAISL
jgi:hypothetical protein